MASIGNDTVLLARLSASFTCDHVKLWLRLSYAQTYASCQGTEFSGPLRLWDVSNKFFSRRHLFVGLACDARCGHWVERLITADRERP